MKTKSFKISLILIVLLSCGDSGIEDPENGDLNKGFKTGDLQNEIEKEYESFIVKLASEKENLKNELLSQIPLFKESLKAKFSKL